MGAKRWILYFMSGGVALFVLAAAFIYIADPYMLNKRINIAHFNDIKADNTNIELIIKTTMLQSRDIKAIMIGSSRIGALDPAAIEQITGKKTLNASLSGSILPVQTLILDYALKNNPDISVVVWGLDFFGFNEAKKPTDRADIADNLDLLKDGKDLSFKTYFDAKTLTDAARVVFKSLFGINGQYTTYLDNGMTVYEWHANQVKAGSYDFEGVKNRHLKEYFANAKSASFYEWRFSQDYAMQYRAMLKELKRRDIAVYLVVLPTYGEYFDALYAAGLGDDYEHFKAQITNIASEFGFRVLDFGGHNEISDNKDYFWDHSHLKWTISPLLFSELFGINDKTIGTWLTPQNVLSHNEELKKGVKTFDFNKLFGRKWEGLQRPTNQKQTP